MDVQLVDERFMRELKQKTFFVLLLLLFLVLGSGCLQALGSQEIPALWKLAVVSDTQGENREIAGNLGVNESVVRAIAGDIATERPDLVLVAGDLVNGWLRTGGTSYASQYANWKKAMEPVYRMKIPIFPVRGNHDVGPERIVLPPLPAHLEPPPGSATQLEKAFKDAFLEPHIPRNGPTGEVGLSYSFFHKNTFIVALDLCGSSQHKVNQEWLERELVAHKSVHVFVYGHEPAFEVRHRDCLAFFRRERDAFWDALGRAGGRIYFCGHDHLYNRAVIIDRAGNQIRQIVAGTGGGHLAPWSGKYGEDDRVRGEYNNSGHHGYVLITINGPQVTVQWKALVYRQEGHSIWQILDSFSYTMP